MTCRPVAGCDVGGPPAGARTEHAQAVAPAARAPRVVGHRGVDLDVRPQRVPRAQRAARAVDRRLGRVLVGESAEQAVPDDQDPAVVAVDVAVVDRVVDAMVRRAGEDAVEPAEPPDVLRVDPVLVQQVDQRHRAEHLGRDACERHRQVEDPAEQRAGARLAQCRREVVVLALVVDDVGRPEQRALVPDAVLPVVTEVVEHQREQPDPRAVGGQPPRRHVLEGPGVDAHAQRAREHAADLRQHAQPDAVDRVVDPVGVAAAQPTPTQFDRDQREEHRRGQRDDLFLHVPSMNEKGQPRKAALSSSACARITSGACRPGRSSRTC